MFPPRRCSWLRAAAACTLVLALLSQARPVHAQARADTIVKLAGRPVHAGLATLSAEISIGVVEGAEEYMFGDVADIVVARDGAIYVYDSQVPAIRKYDASGKFVRTLGRKGQGPGEYISGAGLGLLRDGRLLLWDTRNWRINVYSAAGESEASWSTPSGMSGTGTFSTGRALTVDTAGNVYYRKPIFGRTGGPGLRNVQVIKLRSDGTVLDTIAEPAFTYAPRGVKASSADGRSQMSANIPFEPSPAWALSPHGYLVTGVPNRYAFELHAGSQIVSIRRDQRAEPISASERDAARKRTEEQMRRVDPGWSWGTTDLPKTKPFYTSLAVGADGRIWVTIEPESSARPGGVSGIGSARGAGGLSPRPASRDSKEPAKPALYDVFEPNGAYLGRVQVPPRVSTMYRRGDYVWGVAYDDDDVATVKRFRINWR